MIYFIFFYLLATIAVGIYASKKVKNTKDFILAGRSLPLSISTAALFATWFGSETILGASSRMATEGLQGVIQEPFGAALCLFILGAFFASPLYKMNILTFGDFYRIRYGRIMEVLAGICLVLSYLGWIAAQMVAMGIILHTVTGLEIQLGILFSASIVVFYTYLGGMWSVSLTDFIQTIMIVIGLSACLIEMNSKISISTIFQLTPKSFFHFFPESGIVPSLNYFAAWMVLGLGSIPQQDLFQRVMSAKSERTAVLSSYLASFLYLTIAMIPLILSLYGRYFIPDVLNQDPQMLIPRLVKGFTSPFVQLCFFGAMTSAILSTASGAILAPSSILSENLFKYIIPKNQWGEKKLLALSRFSVILTTVIGLAIALGNKDIFALVEESSAISLVSLFIPLVFGLFSAHCKQIHAIASLLLGTVTWILAEYLQTDVNPILYGLVASLIPIGIAFLFLRDPVEPTK
jgi:SSS family solute:Na+ symporter